MRSTRHTRRAAESRHRLLRVIENPESFRTRVSQDSTDRDRSYIHFSEHIRVAPRRVGRSLRVECRALLHAAHVGGGGVLLDRISAAGVAIGNRLCVRLDGGTVRALLRERNTGTAASFRSKAAQCRSARQLAEPTSGLAWHPRRPHLFAGADSFQRSIHCRRLERRKAVAGRVGISGWANGQLSAAGTGGQRRLRPVGWSPHAPLARSKVARSRAAVDRGHLAVLANRLGAGSSPSRASANGPLNN